MPEPGDGPGPGPGPGSGDGPGDDTGVRSERAFVLLSAAVFLAAAGIGVLYPLLARIQSIHHLPTYALGLMSGANFFAALAAQLGVSRLLDGERARRVLLVGVFLAGASLVWFAHAGDLGQLVAARALEGVGYGIVGPASLREAAVGATGERRGRRLGVLSSAMMAGIVVGPLLGSLLAAAGGIALPFEVVAGLLLLVLVAFVFSPPAGAQAPAPTNDPHDRVLDTADVPAQAPAPTKDPPAGAEGRALDEAEAAPAGARPPARSRAWRPVLAVLLVGAASQLPTGLYDALWSRLLTDRGASSLFVGFSLSAFGIPFVLLAPLGGRIAERRGPLLATTVALVVSDGFMASYGFVPSPVVIGILGVAEACAQAVAVPGGFAAAARAFPEERAATGQGWYSGAGTAAAGFAAVLGAPAYGAFGSGAVFAGGAVISGVVVLAALGVGATTDISVPAGR